MCQVQISTQSITVANLLSRALFGPQPYRSGSAILAMTPAPGRRDVERRGYAPRCRCSSALDRPLAGHRVPQPTEHHRQTVSHTQYHDRLLLREYFAHFCAAASPLIS